MKATTQPAATIIRGGAATAAAAATRSDDGQHYNTNNRRNKKSSSSSFRSIVWENKYSLFVGYISIIFGFVVCRLKMYSGHPMSYLIPNLLIFTPYKELTQKWWDRVLEFPKTPVKHERIPEIDASEYTHDKLREITQNFRIPAVVRGLFSNSTAVRNWGESGYLSDSTRLGDFVIPVSVNRQFNRSDYDRVDVRFGDAYEEMLHDELDPRYFFFPFSLDPAKDELARFVNEVVMPDVEADRIWDGFGNKKYHRSFMGGQFVAGRGFESSQSDTVSGSWWHCAIINNYFIQVVGTKYWTFMDAKHSSYMRPMRYGLANIARGDHMHDLDQYMPLRYGEIHAGDMLFNPEWQWHSIKNAPGLSVALPIREFRPPRSFRQNLQFTLYAAINIILDKGLGYSYALYSNPLVKDTVTKKRTKVIATKDNDNDDDGGGGGERTTVSGNKEEGTTDVQQS